MMQSNQPNMQQRVQLYSSIVQEYEQLDHEIDALIMKNGGLSKNMSTGDRQRYRELARKRSSLFNEMRVLERDLLDEDGDSV